MQDYPQTDQFPRRIPCEFFPFTRYQYPGPLLQDSFGEVFTDNCDESNQCLEAERKRYWQKWQARRKSMSTRNLDQDLPSLPRLTGDFDDSDSDCISQKTCELPSLDSDTDTDLDTEKDRCWGSLSEQEQQNKQNNQNKQIRDTKGYLPFTPLTPQMSNDEMVEFMSFPGRRDIAIKDQWVEINRRNLGCIEVPKSEKHRISYQPQVSTEPWSEWEDRSYSAYKSIDADIALNGHDWITSFD